MKWRFLIAVGVVLLTVPVWSQVFRNPNDPTLQTQAPTVAFVVPTAAATYDAGSASTLNVSGTATAPTGVTTCSWMNSQGGVGIATTASNGSWSVANVQLAVSSSNVITITCQNSQNIPGTTTLTVTRSGSSACVGTCYYIRDGGTASTSGTGACVSTGTGDWTTSHACDDLPATLVRGATYYFAAGNYAHRILNTAQSGTTRITLAAATDALHGTDTGWLSSYDDTPAIWTGSNASISDPIFRFDTGYWTITGQSRDALESGYHIQFNLTTAGGVNEGIVSLHGAAAGSGDIIEYIDARGNAWNGNQTMAELCDGSGGSEFYYDNAVAGGGSNGTILRYNHSMGTNNIMTVHQTQHLTVGPGNVFGLMVSTPNCHSELIAGSGDSDMTIFNNYFRAMQGTGGVVCLNRTGVLNCSNWIIYNNIFYGTNTVNGNSVEIGQGDGVIACINGMTCSNWLIYGNTIAHVADCNGVCTGAHTSFIEFGQAASGSTVTARNNLWESSVNAGNDCSGAGCTYAQNTYSNTTGQNTGETGIQNVSGASFLTNAPNTSRTTTFDVADFHLVRDTSAWSSLGAPYNLDITGATRTSSRGAYQFP